MWDESKHPRDKDGNFTDGRGLKHYRQNASYEETLSQVHIDAKVTDRRSHYAYAEHKARIQSAVFDKISSVRREMNHKGYKYISVYTLDYAYKVKLYGADNDYDYEIINFKTIK